MKYLKNSKLASILLFTIVFFSIQVITEWILNEQIEKNRYIRENIDLALKLQNTNKPIQTQTKVFENFQNSNLLYMSNLQKQEDIDSHSLQNTAQIDIQKTEQSQNNQQETEKSFTTNLLKKNQPELVNKLFISQTLIQIESSGEAELVNNKFKKKTVENNKFDGLILFHEIPTIFHQKQIFLIKGRLVSPPEQGGIYINLILRSIINGQRFSFSHFIESYDPHFSFDINFKDLTGEFYLSLFAGYQGSTDAQIYQIKDQQILQLNNLNNGPQKPSGLNLFIQNNKVKVSWNQNIEISLNRLTFIQDNLKIQYFLSNFHNQFLINEAHFSQFKAGLVQVRLSAAYSQSLSILGKISKFSDEEILTFQACIHHYSEYDKKFIQLKEIPWKVKNNQAIQLKGKSIQDLQNRILILNPNNTFRTQYFKQNKTRIIIKGNQFEKFILFPEKGVYIIELNKATGGAALNRPLYVGQIFPVLPDVVDLSENQFAWKKITQNIKTYEIDLQQQINTFLKLINKKRHQFGVNQLRLSRQLSYLALIHNEDMIQNKYFNHFNLQKQSPQQRAKAIGMKLKIGQNIAMNNNLTQAHERLCRSPIHLQNIVDPEWFQVGIAIKINQYGIYYVTQQFSVRNLKNYPLQNEQYENLHYQLVNTILSQNTQVIKENKILNEIIKYELKYALTTKNQLGSKLAELGFSKFSLGNVKVTYKNKLIQKIKGKQYFKFQGSGYKQFGVALFETQDQYLTICTVYI